MGFARNGVKLYQIVVNTFPTPFFPALNFVQPGVSENTALYRILMSLLIGFLKNAYSLHQLLHQCHIC